MSASMTYYNVEGLLCDVRAMDWRNTMHPDDRAWLDRVEAPLRELGFEPLVYQMGHDHGPINYDG